MLRALHRRRDEAFEPTVPLFSNIFINPIKLYSILISH
ncbi:protein of unknown function [Pararobbsia alpina]